MFPAEIEGFPVTRIGDESFNLVPYNEESKFFKMGGTTVNMITGQFEKTESVPMKVNRTLESVVIPEGVEEIGTTAFRCCENLKSVKLPSSLTIIRGGAFECTVNLKSIDLPNNLIVIHYGAFENSGLEKIVIPESLTDLFSVNMYGWASSLPGFQFRNCKSLKSVVLPDNLYFIPVSTFTGCTALTDVNIPAGIKEICEWAFQYCPLTNLKIPESITSIRFVDYYNKRNKPDNGAFKGTTPPLAMRKRLQDLGYEGSF